MPKNKMPEQFPGALFMDDPFLLSSFPFRFLHGCFFFPFFSPLVSILFLGQGFEQVAVFGNLRLHE